MSAWPLVRRIGGALAVVITLTALPSASSGALTTPKSPPAGAPTFEAPPVPASGAWGWTPPLMQSPIRLTLRSGASQLNLDPARDYVLTMPAPVTSPGGVVIVGGHNVALVGGHITVPDRVRQPDEHARRGLYLMGQTGYVLVADLTIDGADLAEGIDLNQRLGATVILQHIRVATVHGSQTTNHADVLQTWAGPRQLLVDDLVGSTDYQGFFLTPNQLFAGPPPERVELRHVRLTGTNRSAYLLWATKGHTWPLYTEDVVVSPNPTRAVTARDAFLWPKPSSGDTTWNGVTAVRPPLS
jgi:hypothetical protein